jgi:hypothetical protein
MGNRLLDELVKELSALFLVSGVDPSSPTNEALLRRKSHKDHRVAVNVGTPIEQDSRRPVLLRGCNEGLLVVLVKLSDQLNRHSRKLCIAELVSRHALVLTLVRFGKRHLSAPGLANILLVVDGNRLNVLDKLDKRGMFHKTEGRTGT